jgi:hypothetical protein
VIRAEVGVMNHHDIGWVSGSWRLFTIDAVIALGLTLDDFRRVLSPTTSLLLAPNLDHELSEAETCAISISSEESHRTLI